MAFELGFNDPDYFSRLFRKVTGKSIAGFLAEIRDLSGQEGGRDIPNREEVLLTAEELRAIEAILPAGAAAGERYPAMLMEQLNR